MLVHCAHGVGRSTATIVGASDSELSRAHLAAALHSNATPLYSTVPYCATAASSARSAHRTLSRPSAAAIYIVFDTVRTLRVRVRMGGLSQRRSWRPGTLVAPRSETPFSYHLYIKTIILPRQARDKHRESTQKKMAFRIGGVRSLQEAAAGGQAEQAAQGGARCLGGVPKVLAVKHSNKKEENI